MSRRVRAGAVELAVVEAGRGEPPLLLLHGLGGTKEMWEPILPALAERRRVLAGDHRGHGESSKPAEPYTVPDLAGDWRAALDGLGLATVDLLGLSLGGAVAMRLAVDHPARIRRLVLVDTWGTPDPAFATALGERLRLLGGGDLHAYADAAIPQVFSPAWAARHPEALEAYRHRVARAEPATLRAAIEACLTHDMGRDLARVAAPTLVVVGTADRLTPLEHARHLAAAIPRARLAVVDGVAHFPMLEAPTRFLELVEDFLAGPVV